MRIHCKLLLKIYRKLYTTCMISHFGLKSSEQHRNIYYLNSNITFSFKY